MMTEIFGSTLPSVATAAFAGTYVLMISVFNMCGRIIGLPYLTIGRKILIIVSLYLELSYTFQYHFLPLPLVPIL